MNFKVSMLAAMLGVLAASSLHALDEEQKSTELYARSLNAEHIEKYQKQIAADADYNSNLRLAARCVACVGVSATCLLWYNDFNIIHGDQLQQLFGTLQTLETKVNGICACPTLANDKAVQEAAKTALKKGSGGGWGSFIAKSMGMMVFSHFVNMILQKVHAVIFHKQSITWFVREKTVWYKAAEQLEVLKNDVLNLSKGTIPVSHVECDRYVESVVQTFNMMIEQVEQLLAYIAYKVDSVPIEKKKEISSIMTSAFLTHRTADAAKQLNERIAGYRKSTNSDQRILLIRAMFDGIYQLALQVNTETKRFETAEEKCA